LSGLLTITRWVNAIRPRLQCPFGFSDLRRLNWCWFFFTISAAPVRQG